MQKSQPHQLVVGLLYPATLGSMLVAGISAFPGLLVGFMFQRMIVVGLILLLFCYEYLRVAGCTLYPATRMFSDIAVMVCLLLAMTAFIPSLSVYAVDVREIPFLLGMARVARLAWEYSVKNPDTFAVRINQMFASLYFGIFLLQWSVPVGEIVLTAEILFFENLVAVAWRRLDQDYKLALSTARAG
jgi:hypothetical protein